MTSDQLTDAQITVKGQVEGQPYVFEANAKRVTLEANTYDDYNWGEVLYSGITTYRMIADLDGSSGNFGVVRMNAKTVQRSARIDIDDITVEELDAARKRVGAPVEAQIVFDVMRRVETYASDGPRPAEVQFVWNEEV